MTLVRWNPYRDVAPFTGLLDDLQRDVGRLFNLFPSRFNSTGDLLAGAYAPAMDVFDQKDRVIVRVDLPGLKKEDIDISVVGQTLTIKGEKKNEAELKDENVYLTERVFGSFSRSLTLPDGVEPGNIKASYKDGVLEIEVTKTEKARPRQITVNVG